VGTIAVFRSVFFDYMALQTVFFGDFAHWEIWKKDFSQIRLSYEIPKGAGTTILGNVRSLINKEVGGYF